MCAPDPEYRAWLLRTFQHGDLLDRVEHMLGEYMYVTEALYGLLRDMGDFELADLLAANGCDDDDLLWQAEQAQGAA